jgi:thiol:disulfide interchange protein DsbD
MQRPLIAILAVISLAIATQALAKPWWLRGVESNETDFLPPDVAFRVGAHIEGSAVKLRWVIAPGYYLYRRKMSAVAESPDLLVTDLLLPRGTLKTDPFLGTQEIFTQIVEGTVPFRRLDYGAHPVAIKVTYQGCAEAGLCYPPIMKVLSPTAAEAADPTTAPARWQGIAIAGGVAAFLVSGLVLRRGRRLEPPPP